MSWTGCFRKILSLVYFIFIFIFIFSFKKRNTGTSFTEYLYKIAFLTKKLFIYFNYKLILLLFWNNIMLFFYYLYFFTFVLPFKIFRRHGVGRQTSPLSAFLQINIPSYEIFKERLCVRTLIKLFCFLFFCDILFSIFLISQI